MPNLGGSASSAAGMVKEKHGEGGHGEESNSMVDNTLTGNNMANINSDLAMIMMNIWAC